MIKPISRYLKLKKQQSEKIQQQYEELSWLYSESRFRRMTACYFYSMPGHLLITLPSILLINYLIG